MYNVEKINDHQSLAILDLALFRTENAIDNKRVSEQKGTGFLLEKLFSGKKINLNYSGTGKPYLKGETTHISVSHSHDKLVLLTNDKQSTGVDIELIRDKIINIKHKFLSEKELMFCGDNNESLTAFWAAKECLYKVYGLKEVDFIANLFIENFSPAENNFFGSIDLPNFKKRYLLSRRKIDNYILVFILSEV